MRAEPTNDHERGRADLFFPRPCRRRPDQVFHVAVMPCYDKKLEASRPDFATSHPSPDPTTSSETVSVRDVDLVLTTGEVAKMLEDEGVSLRSLGAREDAGEGAKECDGQAEGAYFPFSDLLAPPRGTSSGSYVATALSALLSSPSPSPSSSPSADDPAPTASSSAPRQITRADWPHLRLDAKLVRSEDYVEYSLVRLPSPYSPATLEDQPRGQVLARAAKCYGFRNLQNVVRKLSREAGVSLARGAAGRAAPVRRRAAGSGAPAGAGAGARAEPDVEFIEVMACPGGCTNGGGQVPPPRNSARARRAGEARLGVGVGNRVARVDDEGMPDVQAEVLEAELKLVADPAAGAKARPGAGGGDERDRVLSAKEWVAEVERRYWSGRDKDVPKRGGEEEEDGLLASLHPSIRPYVALLPTASEQAALQRVLDELLGPGEDDREAQRRELLRTSYRAVQSEEVNGLAVVW